jgi:AcrR family transcriptional regulator
MYNPQDGVRSERKEDGMTRETETASQTGDGQPGSGDFIWQRIEQQARTALTHAQIASAAVELADAGGLEALSMRRLAQRLGIATMGTYRYVRGKDELIELMVDAVYADAAMAAADVTAGWRAAMERTAHELRALFSQHPWLLGIGVTSPLTPNATKYTDRALASLAGTGLDEDTKMAVLQTVRSYVAGVAGSRLALAALLGQQDVSGMDELRQRLASRMTWLLGSGKYPAFQRYIQGGIRKDDTDWQFQLGLDCILDGIATRLGI